MAWDKDKPAGSQKIRLSDEEIRANWTALQDALGREHTFPGVMGDTAGKHAPLIANLQQQLYTAAAAGGTVDAITATFDPPLAALTNNTKVCVIAAGANVTTTPTFAPDGLTAKTIVKGANQAVVAGDIPGANYPAFLQYNLTIDAWVLLNPNPICVREKFALLQNRQNQNVGGGTTTSGSWLVVPLNTEQEDVDGIVDSSALPVFKPIAGLYRVEALCPFWSSTFRQIRLVSSVIGDFSDSVVELIGTSIYGYSNEEVVPSHLIGTITADDSKKYRLEYQLTAGVVDGHGRPANFGVEVYAQLWLKKIP